MNCEEVGATFVRADLHVHLVPDGEDRPREETAAYLDAAEAQGIQVLGITDHNTARFVADALREAEYRPLLVLPGVELSTRDGHLVALFDPADVGELESFATVENLELGEPLPDGSRRSKRTMLSLVDDIGDRHGIAFVAHCDANGGIQNSMNPGELRELLLHPALAGLEFTNIDSLEKWFRGDDEDDTRREAWRAREAVAELRDRGMARVMSSDAHSAALVGKDGNQRPLTRLRLGDLTFTSVRNALEQNPKSRCKVEAGLPASYPHVVSAAFEGGFLDGVEVCFSPNLNCIIGGRGSGKSTMLLAMRAALGAILPDDDDPDEAGRMPDRTVVEFIDAAGSERRAIRERGQPSVDDEGLPVSLGLSDLAQGESAAVAADYRDQRTRMLEYLDSFCDLQEDLGAERQALEDLSDNAAEVKRTAFRSEDYKRIDERRRQLNASIKAAQSGKLDEIAKAALTLATQSTLVERLQVYLEEVGETPKTEVVPKLETIASETSTDLEVEPIKGVRASLESALAELNRQATETTVSRDEAVAAATREVEVVIEEWQTGYKQWEERREQKKKELEEQGLEVQVGALEEMGRQLRQCTTQLNDLQEKRRQHAEARSQRKGLLNELRACRERIFQRRKASLKRVSTRANESVAGLEVGVGYTPCGMLRPWMDWLGPRYRFKADRLRRLAGAITPWEFAKCVTEGDLAGIESLEDVDGDHRRFFSSEHIEDIGSLTWDDIFELETMRLEDLPRIYVTQAGDVREFDNLSAGQQHSVLLSLLLCADRNEPLVVDQPEDHLDAPFVATAVVTSLEMAKERRQVIIATHNANLTVLGDAELVVPLYGTGVQARIEDVGAVDHPRTLARVCTLLEGGAAAFARRGRRYGFSIQEVPTDLLEG